LHVPFDHGYPLGKPHDAPGQRRVLNAMLQLLEMRHAEGPVLRDLGDFTPNDAT